MHSTFCGDTEFFCGETEPLRRGRLQLLDSSSTTSFIMPLSSISLSSNEESRTSLSVDSASSARDSCVGFSGLLLASTNSSSADLGVSSTSASGCGFRRGVEGGSGTTTGASGSGSGASATSGTTEVSSSTRLEGMISESVGDLDLALLLRRVRRVPRLEPGALGNLSLGLCCPIVGVPGGEENSQLSKELLALDFVWISARSGLGLGSGGDEGGSAYSSICSICPRRGVGVRLINSS